MIIKNINSPLRDVKITSDTLFSLPNVLTFPLPHEDLGTLKEIFKDRKKVLTIAGYGYGFSFLENSQVTAVDKCPMQIAENLLIKKMILKLEYQQMIDILHELSNKKRMTEDMIALFSEGVQPEFKIYVEKTAKELYYHFYGLLFDKKINILEFFPFLNERYLFYKIKNSILQENLKLILGYIPDSLGSIIDKNTDSIYLSNLFDHISSKEKKELCTILGASNISMVVFAQIAFPTQQYGKKGFIAEMELLLRSQGFNECNSFIGQSPLLETEIKYSILKK